MPQMRTPVCDLVGAPHPLFGFSRSPGVVAAVTNAGGVGVLPAHHYAPDELDEVLTDLDRAVGDRRYGIDLVVPPMETEGTDHQQVIAEMKARIPAESLDFVDRLLERHRVPTGYEPVESHGRLGPEEAAAGVNPSWVEPLLEVAFKHQIGLVANALGTPPPTLLDCCRDAGVPIAALVGSKKHALRQLEAGVDILVAQGTEAGGHTGTIATMVLTPEIVDVAGYTPVLAAGGVASGRQMAAALALGAQGAWAGSVWLSSHEDITVDSVKRKFLAASAEDTVRSTTRTGKPARQLRSAWHDAWEEPNAPRTIGLPLQLMLTSRAWERIDAAAEKGHEGALALESFFIGQVVGSFSELRPAYDIARSIIEECDAVLAYLGARAARP